MTAAALRLVPAPPESTVKLQLPSGLLGRIDERAKRKQLTRLELLEGLFPGELPDSKDPTWRARLVGIYTDADERAERDVLGWLLCGGDYPPFTLRAELFLSRWHRLLFVACTAAKYGARECGPPDAFAVRVLRYLRFYGHTQGTAAAIAELMDESLEFAEPPSFQSFLERAELRLRVMRLEREVDELRKGLR